MKPIIIDTDMGYDDIIAIGLLLLSNKFRIKAISVVNGVASLTPGVNNLARILSFTNTLNIPLFKGKSRPFKDNWKASFPKIDIRRANNLTLLSKLAIPNKTQPIKIYNSLNKMISLIVNSSQKITLICLGPLMNMAYLINKYRNKFTSQINEIILLGGAVKVSGIVPPLNIAEYNIYLDPEAADIVFKSKVPITVVPIDATKQVPAKREISMNKTASNKISQIMKEIIENNNRDFDSFYDPLVAGILINPQIIKESIFGRIQVVKKGQNRGQTKLIKDTTSNIRIITKINSKLFYQTLLSYLY